MLGVPFEVKTSSSSVAVWFAAFSGLCFFFNAEVVFRHSRPAAFSLNTPNHVITRDLFPLSEILNMPGIPEFCLSQVPTASARWSGRLPSPGMASCPWDCLTRWSFSPGAGRRRERLLNLIFRDIRVMVFQRLQDFHIACIPRFQLALNSDGRVGVWQVFHCRSQVCPLFDGCIIATRSPTIWPSCVKATHRWEPGMLAGD